MTTTPQQPGPLPTLTAGTAPAATARATGTFTALLPGRGAARQGPGGAARPGPGVPWQPMHSAGSRTPLFDTLARDWAARGATVPGTPDPVWERLASWEHLRWETECTLRSLHLQGSGFASDAPAWASGIW
ncbi:hypothetical protein AB0B01_15440 [Streptomyces sp. NPDC044571]|uniref:hypothetical protein n=1 Tax=Streptomyces sp. NPDC044571 TaxID=3155371 RepID=UPI0033E1F21A